MGSTGLTATETGVTVARNIAAVVVLLLFANSPVPAALASVLVAVTLLAVPIGLRPERVSVDGPHQARSNASAFASNFVFGLGLIGGLELLVRSHGHPSGLAAVLLVAPAIWVAWVAGREVRRVFTDDATEFEAFVVVRAAAVSFVVLLATSLLYALGELLFDLPSVHAWWVLVVGAAQFGITLKLLRDRLS
jgi:hypothetical protein